MRQFDRPFRFHLYHFIHRNALVQLAIVFAFWGLGELIVAAVGWSLPGSIVGLALLLLVLASRRVSAVSLRTGSRWLLADMLLFFVPAVLAVVDHDEFLGLVGLKVLFVILASTAAVMVVTGFIVDRCHRWRSVHERVASGPR